MLQLFHVIYDTFWSAHIWLPPNVTWADIEPGSRPGVTYTRSTDLYLPIPLAVFFLFIRFLLEKYWYTPVGIYLGIKPLRVKKCQNNAVLERAYLDANKQDLNHKQVQKIAKELSYSERKVLRWFRIRKTHDKTSKLTKFCETSWRFTYYITSFGYGLAILWTKPWFWDINQCWDQYPHQSVSVDVWWYYMMNLAFYYSLIMSQFRDVKRKDFWQMFVHHFAAVLLMSLSWLCMLTRIGSLVLVVHDCADILLELAKLCKYAGKQTICDVVFAIFTLVWLITRVGVYPSWIIYNTSVVAPELVAMFPAYYIFNTLLILLLVLHIFWTTLILKIAYRALSAGMMEGDIRSSSSATYSSSSHHSHSD